MNTVGCIKCGAAAPPSYLLHRLHTASHIVTSAWLAERHRIEWDHYDTIHFGLCDRCSIKAGRADSVESLYGNLFAFAVINTAIVGGLFFRSDELRPPAWTIPALAAVGVLWLMRIIARHKADRTRILSPEQRRQLAYSLAEAKYDTEYKRRNRCILLTDEQVGPEELARYRVLAQNPSPYRDEEGRPTTG
jgi:hypothetical protein